MSTFTVEDIAVAAHHKLGLDVARAEEILGAEIRKIERRESRRIDPEAIGEHDTSVLIDAIEITQYDVLTDCMSRLARAARDSEASVAARDVAVFDALSAGATWPSVISVTGLSRSQVAEIRKVGRA
ncbi:hypothetical protein [Corynebacterium sp.]|uniref:hypothetical protein n=1 Tax=Corynebacterium sp. TaxID=1720 RepID=UPI0025C482FE|nr:hypothetical protein [Corynebacterium sp.]